MVTQHQNRLRTRAKAIVAMVVIAVVIAACGGAASGSTTPTPVRGGTLVIGAGGEPGCAAWLEPCVGSIWGPYMMRLETMPQPFIFSKGQYAITPLLAGQPTLEAGPPQRVTYRINPRAVWSDGQPITSADFEYTYEQARSQSPEIRSVEHSDPQTAVVTFAHPFPEWQEEFAPLLPSHLLQGRDRDAIMRNGYSFSGGPWLIDHWTRGQEVKLVPNPRYWGEKPRLDAIVFKIFSDTSAFITAYETGQIDVAYFTNAGSVTAPLRGIAHTQYDSDLGLNWSGLWFNVEKPPLDSLAVRKALAYATDRNAIVSQVFGSILPGVKADQAFMSPANRSWYSAPFAAYGRNLSMVTQLMTSDGWSRGADGIWAKRGARAALVFTTAAGIHDAELEEQIIQSQWKAAGFDVSIDNSPQPTLFGDRLPKGTFQVGLFGLVPLNTDPGLCHRFCSMYIPNEANGYHGGSVTHLADANLDRVWQAVDQELNVNKRVELVHEGQQLLAQLVPVVPLSTGPNVLVYNTAKVGGPISNAPTGPFDNLNQWYCVSEQCRA